MLDLEKLNGSTYEFSSLSKTTNNTPEKDTRNLKFIHKIEETFEHLEQDKTGETAKFYNEYDDRHRQLKEMLMSGKDQIKIFQSVDNRRNMDNVKSFTHRISSLNPNG